MTESPGAIVIDTAVVPITKRLDYVRDGLKDSIGAFDVAPLGDGPMRQVFKLHALQEAAVVSFQSSAVEVRRKADLDGEPALSLNIMRSGSVLRQNQLGREVEVRPGGAFLNALYEPFVCGSPQAHGFDMLRLPRAAMALRLPDVEAVARRGEAEPNALALLTGYLDLLTANAARLSPELASAAKEHLYDLAALALGASREGRALAARGGVPAARLATIKRHVADRLVDPNLSAAGVARRFAISERYLRLLFEAEGGFWGHVTARRLDLAAKLLREPAMAEVKVIELAYRCGFGSLSAFNRAFARRFGCSPGSFR